jgi:hypothetical protein
MLDAMEELTVDGSYMAGSVYNSEDEHHGDENGEETEFIVGLQKEKEMSAGVTTEDAKSSNTSDKSGKPSRESLSPSARIAQRNLLDSRHLVSEEDRPYWPDYAERYVPKSYVYQPPCQRRRDFSPRLVFSNLLVA